MQSQKLYLVTIGLFGINLSFCLDVALNPFTGILITVILLRSNTMSKGTILCRACTQFQMVNP